MKQFSMKQFSTQLLFFIAVAFLFISCSQDPIDSENENQLYLEQIDFKTTTQADVFKSLKTAKSQNKSSQNDFVSYSSSDLYYDPITNSSERLAVIPANTPLPNTYNRILTATINDSVRTVLFQMLPKIGHHGDSLYTGKVIISDLNGHFIKGYSIKNGNQISYYKLRLNKPHKNGGTPCAEHTEWNGDCYFCQQTLDEVIIQAPPSNGDNLTTISSLFDDLQFDNGANGYDTGMNWDYGSGGGGGSPATTEDPILKPDCSSFEFYRPPGGLVRASAITGFANTFYALDWQGVHITKVEFGTVYFSMPIYMTNGQAATKTAIALDRAIRKTEDWYNTNTNANSTQVTYEFRKNISSELNKFSGSWSGIAPFEFKNTSEYKVRVGTTGNCD